MTSPAPHLQECRPSEGWCAEGCPRYPEIEAALRPPEHSAAKGWRNAVPCTCSVTLTEKRGVVVDKSHCPRHGKAAKS